MIRRILLPLERCDDDGGAVAFAETLSRRRRVELLLVRVEEWPMFGSFGLGWVPAWRASELDGVKSRLDAEEGVRARILSTESSPTHAVMEQARQCEASLILVSYRQEGPLMRVMHGSPADRILRDAPVPVLAVPGPARPVSRILYLFDGSKAAVPGLRHVIDFAQLFEAKVALLRIGPPPSSSGVGEPSSVEERLLSILQRREVPARVVAGSDDVAGVVSREESDLVILSRTEKTGRTRTALARQLLQRSSVPLLMASEGSLQGPLIGARVPLRVGI